MDIVRLSPDDISAHKNSDPPDHLYPLSVKFLKDKNRVILGDWGEIDVQTHSDDVVYFVVEILGKNELAEYRNILLLF